MTQNLISYPDLPDFLDYIMKELLQGLLNNKVLKKVSLTHFISALIAFVEI